ncbi:hypothetical protein BDW02DRAFT_10970 [Decorospora gaudefroyi]|uniref:Uncharacterized protein n=1 Tax=Decorospora gaudefroyi TaxID=184978 RepID=A0A6A5KU15_9PLEO|nr:hypothetical protein BDW02DRAFT_10970 [Decorospora gaudefroyi]
MIIASRYTASGSLEVVKQPTTPEFKQYYDDIVRDYETPTEEDNPGDKKEDIMATLKNALAPLTATLTEKLGHTPIYVSLFLPSVFKSQKHYAHVRALYDNETMHLNHMTRHQAASVAMCSCWGFANGKDIGGGWWDPGTQDQILVLEYEQDYLLASLHDLEWSMPFFADFEHFSRECGERYHEQQGDTETYTERLTTFVNDYLDSHDPKWFGREKIRAIVVAGEASPHAISTLADIARKAVGTDTVQVRTNTSFPQAVVARGAAAWARYSGQAYVSTPCMPLSHYMTKHEYEKQMQANAEMIEQMLDEYLEPGAGPVPPEKWAKMKPKLITAAGEGAMDTSLFSGEF